MVAPPPAIRRRWRLQRRVSGCSATAARESKSPGTNSVPGAYTVIGQAAAERLGVPFEKVSVFIGDSDLPPGPVAGGSNSTASTCSAVITVCERIRRRLFEAPAPEEGLVDKAKETIGLAKTPSTQAAQSNRPLDIERAFDALGGSVMA